MNTLDLLIAKNGNFMSVVAFSMLLKKSSYESYWNESKPLCVTIQMKAT